MWVGRGYLSRSHGHNKDRRKYIRYAESNKAEVQWIRRTFERRHSKEEARWKTCTKCSDQNTNISLMNICYGDEPSWCNSMVNIGWDREGMAPETSNCTLLKAHQKLAFRIITSICSAVSPGPARSQARTHVTMTRT